MTPESPATTDRSPWPLRVTLGLVLTVLLITGDRLVAHDQATTTTTSAVATTTTTSGGPSSTTTPPVTSTTTTHARLVDAPVVNPGSLDQAARGCGLHVTPAATAPTTSTSTPPTSTTLGSTTTVARRVIGVGHCTVLEIGDSLGNDLGWGLAREIIRPLGLRVIQLDKSSTGLTASWFFNWPHHLRAALARYHPNLVIVCLGANDEQALAIRGASQAFSSPRWTTVYRERVRQIVDLATHAGSYVLWVGLPIMEPAGYNRGVNFLNAQYRAVAPSVPGGSFQPTWRLMASPSGTFRAGARVNSVEAALRAPDGIHMTTVGEDVFATFIVHQINAIYHVALRVRAPMLING